MQAVKEAIAKAISGITGDNGDFFVATGTFSVVEGAAGADVRGFGSSNSP